MTNTIRSRCGIAVRTGHRAHRVARQRAVALGLSAAALLCVPLHEAAAAQATWSPEAVVAVPSPNGSIYARTAVNANGAAALVWDERVDDYTSDVYAAVNSGGTWTAPLRLTASPTAYNSPSGVVVAPDGKVTAYWSEGETPYYRIHANGAWSPAAVIPADSGYGQVAGAGVDSNGDVQLLLAATRVNGSYRSYDAEVLVLDRLGNWTAPTVLTKTPGGFPRLLVNSHGQGMVVAGYLAWRSAGPGAWNTTPKAIPSKAGQTYATDAALDAAGNGYFVLYNRYGGMNISTSTPTSNWTALRHLAKFDPLGSSLAITGGGAGGAMLYGVDYMTGKLRASTTATAGKSWGSLYTFDVVTTQADAAGGESGLYAIAWDGKVTAGTGIGVKTVAWNTQPLSPNPYVGSVAVAADRAVAGWVRGSDPSLVEMVIGASTGVLAP
jgi:hypothetical protein